MSGFLEELDVMGTAVLDDTLVKARADFLCRQEEQRQRMDEYSKSINSSSNKILLAFLCDATGSMQEHMNLMRNVVRDLSKLLKKNFEDMSLSLMVVLYRDPLEETHDP